MKNFDSYMVYKGFIGTIQQDEENGTFSGYIADDATCWTGLTCKGADLEKLEEDFHRQVDKYLEEHEICSGVNPADFNWPL